MIVEYKMDVLKPHQPTNDYLARALKSLQGITLVKMKVDEIDIKTTSVYIRIRGDETTSLENIEKCLEENNCSLHSIDEVIMANDDIDLRYDKLKKDKT